MRRSALCRDWVIAVFRNSMLKAFPVLRKVLVERLADNEWREIKFKDIKAGDIIRYKKPISRRIIKIGGHEWYRAAEDAYRLQSRKRKGDSIYAEYGCDVYLE